MINVVVVEDQAMVRGAISRLLTLEDNIDVVGEAENGDAAIELLSQLQNSNQRVDIVLTDIEMPNMTGISMVSKIRRLEGYEYTPIIMLTTESSDFKKEKAKKTGATGWLQKPFDPDRLMKAVNKLVN